MKIITPGRSQQGWSIETECTGSGNGGGGCNAVLLIEEPDLFRTESHCRDETEVYTTFRCMSCGVETDIDVPGQVAAKLPSKNKWLYNF